MGNNRMTRIFFNRYIMGLAYDTLWYIKDSQKFKREFSEPIHL